MILRLINPLSLLSKGRHENVNAVKNAHLTKEDRIKSDRIVTLLFFATTFFAIMTVYYFLGQ